jgi:predicted nucleotidyltransferase
VDPEPVIAVLRAAGARFAFVFGSRAEGRERCDSDLDVAAWWGSEPPAPWKVPVPDGVDLLVLDHTPLELAGRVAMRGVLLFDDDPPARVAWQADTRTVYLDDLPGYRARQREWAEVVSARG